MIYVTGDVHGFKDTARFYNSFFLKSVNKPENTVLIIGDFGVTWTKEAMEKSIAFYSNFQCKFMFIDGNNENFDILNKLPVTEMNGGKVHKVSDNIFHMMRGEIFDIEGVKILAFGGADSWDAPIRCSNLGRRQLGINWWPEESPTEEEFQHCLSNLEKHGNKVDIILTHETTTENVRRDYYWSITDRTCAMLQELEGKADYRMWYFGHHHVEGHPGNHPNQQCIFTSFDNVSVVAEKQPFKSDLMTSGTDGM